MRRCLSGSILHLGVGRLSNTFPCYQCNIIKFITIISTLSAIILSRRPIFFNVVVRVFLEEPISTPLTMDALFIDILQLKKRIVELKIWIRQSFLSTQAFRGLGARLQTSIYHLCLPSILHGVQYDHKDFQFGLEYFYA